MPLVPQLVYIAMILMHLCIPNAIRVSNLAIVQNKKIKHLLIYSYFDVTAIVILVSNEHIVINLKLKIHLNIQTKRINKFMFYFRTSVNAYMYS